MSRRTFATFDGAHMGAELELSNAGQIVTFNGTPSDAHRMVRSTLALSLDSGNAEFMVYGDETLGTGKVYVGLVNASASTSAYVGEDANGYGFRLDDGKVYNNGAVVATLSAVAKDAYIQVQFDAPSSTMSVLAGGAIIGTVSLPQVGSAPTNDSWYFAATVSGTTAGGLSMFVNAGQQEFSTENSTATGWWTPIEAIGAVLLATEPYMSAADDDVPNQAYDAVNGRIEQGEGISITSGVSFWPDGPGSATQAGVSAIRIADPGDTYGYLLDSDIRDLPVVIKSVPVRGAMSAAVTVGSSVIERVECEGDYFKVVYLVGPMQQLDVRLQGRLFPPNAQQQVAGRPWPTLIGFARNFEPPLFDEDNKRYAASHVAMQALGTLRVKGKAAVIGQDYTVLTDGTGFTLMDSMGSPSLIPDGKPDGKFTAEASSVGDGFDPGGTDYLAGAGEWLSEQSGGIPTGWDQSLVSTLTGAGTQPGLPYRVSSGVMAFPGGYETSAALGITSAPIKAGRSYAYQIHILQLPSGGGGGPAPGGGSAFNIAFGPAVINTGIVSGAPFSNPYVNFFATGTYTGVFTNTADFDQDLWINYYNGALDGVEGRIGTFILQELPAIDEVVALQGVGLETYARICIEDRGKLASSIWASSDCAAIDTATGYEIGNWTADPITVRQMLAPALDTFGACMFPRQDGLIGTARIVAPEDTADDDLAFDLTQNDFLTQMAKRQDTAPGLTTQFLVRKNFAPYGDGEFGTFDTADVTVGLRKKLGKQYQLVVYSGVQLANMYRHAQTAEPLATLFDDPAFAQTEVDRVCSIFTVPRAFYTVDVAFPPGSTLEVGQVGRITYPYHGLSEGKNVQIRSIVRYPADERATITFWG